MVKIIQPVQLQTATHGDIMAVCIPKQLIGFPDSIDWFFFLDLKQVADLGIQELDLQALRGDQRLRRYFYAEKKADITQLNDGLAHMGDDFYDALEKLSNRNSLRQLKLKTFDPKNLYWFYSDAHLFFKFRGKNPISRPYYKSYIGGVTNEYYDLDKAEKILLKNKWVTSVERTKIPYYNAEPGCDRAVHFIVKLPQKEYDKLVKRFRDTQKEEFWTCRLEESLTAHYSLKTLDPLGLKSALK